MKTQSLGVKKDKASVRKPQRSTMMMTLELVYRVVIIF